MTVNLKEGEGWGEGAQRRKRGKSPIYKCIVSNIASDFRQLHSYIGVDSLRMSKKSFARQNHRKFGPETDQCQRLLDLQSIVLTTGGTA